MQKIPPEINTMVFSGERSFIQSFTQMRKKNDCYTPKRELQSIRTSEGLA